MVGAESDILAGRYGKPMTEDFIILLFTLWASFAALLFAGLAGRYYQPRPKQKGR